MLVVANLARFRRYRKVVGSGIEVQWLILKGGAAACELRIQADSD